MQATPMMQARYQSFIVRVLVDPTGHTQHGTVVHAESGARKSFRSVSDIGGIISDTLLDAAKAESPPGQESGGGGDANAI